MLSLLVVVTNKRTEYTASARSRQHLDPVGRLGKWTGTDRPDWRFRVWRLTRSCATARNASWLCPSSRMRAGSGWPESRPSDDPSWTLDRRAKWRELPDVRDDRVSQQHRSPGDERTCCRLAAEQTQH